MRKNLYGFLLALLMTVMAACHGGGSSSSSDSGSGEGDTASSAKAITAFSLNGAAGTIDEDAKTISVTLPYGTPVTSLIAAFTTTGAGVQVASVDQISGTTANDFSSPVTYTVTAADSSTAAYTVTVSVAEASDQLYLCGPAAGGWDFAFSVEMPSSAANTYYNRVYLIHGETFRLFAAKAWDAAQYNHTYFTTVDADLENAGDGAANFRVAGASGYYAITVNLKVKTIVMEPVDFVHTPDLPAVPVDSGFDTSVTDAAADNAVTQMRFGAAGNDKIVQYGGAATATQYAEGSEGNDWILQQGGANTAMQQLVTGDGDDTVYQYAGSSATTQSIGGGNGTQTLVQVGGAGADRMTVSANTGTSTISQYGGAGNDAMDTAGSTGNDTIGMYGQAGDDTMTYSCSAGADTVTINGGDGVDSITIYEISGSNMTLNDANGNLLYTSGSGGAAITVVGGETITVKDSAGNTVYP